METNDCDKPSRPSSNSGFSLKRVFTKLSNLRRKSSGNGDFNRRDANDPYLYITNFEQATDEECLAADKTNEGIYREELQTYKEITGIMERKNASFAKPSAPNHPPKPSNIEQLHDYRRKYVKTVALDQTEAVIYLHSIGKKYVRCQTNDPNAFEAYEAIELAKKIQSHFKGPEMFQERIPQQAWEERSELMSTELRNQARLNRVQSVYDLEHTTDYHNNVRRATISGGIAPKGVTTSAAPPAPQVYPLLPTAPSKGIDHISLTYQPTQLASAPPPLDSQT